VLEDGGVAARGTHEELLQESELYAEIAAKGLPDQVFLNRDPIERVKAYLSRSGQADARFFESVEEEGVALAAQVRAACVDMPDPDPLEIFTEVYAEQTPHLTAQRDGYAAYLESFEEAQH